MVGGKWDPIVARIRKPLALLPFAETHHTTFFSANLEDQMHPHDLTSGSLRVILYHQEPLTSNNRLCNQRPGRRLLTAFYPLSYQVAIYSSMWSMLLNACDWWASVVFMRSR